jgi:4-hydroxybenzoate polyprenyltransferase
VNDVLDSERDRRHPRKRLRPLAAGELSRGAALASAVLLGAGGLLLAFVVQPWFGAMAVLYVVLTQLYSFGAKNVVVLDILLIASGFVIRALAGAVVIEVPTSTWFVSCTLFLSLFLALCKRKAELVSLGDGAGEHRPVLDHYTDETLRVLTAASLASLLMSYALYVLDVRDRTGEGFHPFELTLPFVLYGVFRYYLLVETRGMGGAPEEVLLKDRGIWIAVLGFSLVALASLYGA